MRFSPVVLEGDNPPGATILRVDLSRVADAAGDRGDRRGQVDWSTDKAVPDEEDAQVPLLRARAARCGSAQSSTTSAAASAFTPPRERRAR